MTYNKPPNMTFTAMAIYFDNNIYTSDRDDNILYQYLYHICYMLACKLRYFRDYEDYDEFALYASAKIYLRYSSKDVCESTPLEKRYISILNYTKAVMYPLKVDYQRETYAQTYDYKKEYKAENFVNLTKESIQKDYSEGLYESVIDALKLLPKIIKKIVKETPYRNDVLMSKKLYMSCLLTFINSMTLSNKKIEKIKRKKDINKKEDLFLKNLQREKQDAVMTWHLDDSFKDYISVLTNKIRREINNDINDIQISYSLSDSELNGIMASAFSNTGNNYEENN